MAVIASFRGYRFNPSVVGDLNKVVTQPYDKIDDKLRAEYLYRSDYNLVRIIKNPPTGLDTPIDNQYTRAKTFWDQWLEERALIREAGPAIYPYHQEFTVEGKTYTRKGLIALVKLDDAKSKVRAHEKTLSGPKADRLKLMRATEANDGLIFMLYNDEVNAVNNMLDQELAVARPVMEVTDDYQAKHKLYRVTSPGVVRDVSEVLENLELFIADGHHRYETALNYMEECKKRNWKPVGVETFNYRMMAMINMKDPGLVVLPTHRVLHSLSNYSGTAFLNKAAEAFNIEQFSDKGALYAALDRAGNEGKTAFGWASVGVDGYRLLTLKDYGLMNRLVTDHSETWRKLDVTVLHVAILEKMLGIDAEKLASETNVHYVRGRDEALDYIGKEHYQAAFLINPTRVDQVKDVASAGERMPQKSTDFFPKLLSGMVLMKMNIDKSDGLASFQIDE